MIDLIKYYASRKLFFSAISIMSIMLVMFNSEKAGLPDGVLLVSLPLAIGGVVIICVTYVTGQAKIDIQAKYGKSDDSH